MEGKVEKALCICNHCGPHWPFGIPAWYLSDKKWRFGFKRYEKVPVWHIVPYRPTSSRGVCGRARLYQYPYWLLHVYDTQMSLVYSVMGRDVATSNVSATKQRIETQ